MHLLLTFVIPWLAAAYLLVQNKRTVVLYGPAAAGIAFALNDIGLYMEWWGFKPEREELLISLLSNLGIFLVSGCYMIHFIQKYKYSLIMILGFASLLTLLEYVYLLLGRIHFNNGWNLGWSFVSYVVSNILLYGYFLLLDRTKKSTSSI